MLTNFTMIVTYFFKVILQEINGPYIFEMPYLMMKQYSFHKLYVNLKNFAISLKIHKFLTAFDII